jgi:hypothetical protein
MRVSYGLVALLLLMGSCTPGISTGNCLPLKKWSKEQQIEAATDLGSVAEDSPVFGMVDDYWELHKRIEACHKVNGGL